MKIPLFDELTEPPVKGQFYMVRCVLAEFRGKSAWWPVWGLRHEDAKWINFPPVHYHLNRYFLTGENETRSVALPISENFSFGQTLPYPELRRRMCRQSAVTPFPLGMALDSPMWAKMYRHYAGIQCKRGNGWICPHKGFDLGPMMLGSDGFIQCPLHGLLINAETGVVGKA